MVIQVTRNTVEKNMYFWNTACSHWVCMHFHMYMIQQPWPLTSDIDNPVGSRTSYMHVASTGFEGRNVKYMYLPYQQVFPRRNLHESGQEQLFLTLVRTSNVTNCNAHSWNETPHWDVLLDTFGDDLHSCFILWCRHFTALRFLVSWCITVALYTPIPHIGIGMEIPGSDCWGNLESTDAIYFD